MCERVNESVDISGCLGLDGYSFFGLNLPHVVYALESDYDSIYHAIPPANFPAYQYHLVEQKSTNIIRAREERVGL